MNKTVFMLAALASVSWAAGAEVWTATFDVDTDGVVQILNGNTDTDMIGPVVNGALTITTYDDDFLGDPYTPDKAGRPLGATLGAGDSFSALYRFQWSDLWGDPVLEDGRQAYEVAAFLGSNGAPQTRQVIGALMIHWQIADGSYYIWIGSIVGGSGDQVIKFSGDGAVRLGPQAENRDYALAIGWDGVTNTVEVGLYDGITGALVTGDTNVIAAPPPFVLDFQMTHLGWSDYTGNGYSPDKPNVWAVDELSYYDAFDDAFNAIVPPTGKVWESTFDADMDGFVDVWDGAPKAMLTAPVGGKLGVHQLDDDALGYPFTPDKSGRSMGVVNDTFSWSALYKFRWTGLPTQEVPQTYQFTGAFGLRAAQTRDVVGALMTHWAVGSDFYTNLGLIVGGTGDQLTDQSGPSLYLGPNYALTDYQLAIGWDAGTHTVSAQLFLGDGTPVGTSGVMSMVAPDPTPQVTDFTLTHLGWSDYTGDINTSTSVDWDVDSVAYYFGDATLAFTDAAGALPGDLDGDGDVDLVDYAILADCLAGPGVATPPGGCLPADFTAADLDNDLDVDLGDFKVFQVNFGP